MKNNNLIILWDAYNSFRKKRFTEAIILLEKIAADRLINPYANFLLCINYLLNNRFNDADNSIKKIRSSDPEYLPLVQLEAFLLLKSASDIHSVTTAYLDRLSRYPEDKYFKKTIKTLRRIKDFSAFQKKAKLVDFVSVPKPQLNSAGNSASDYYLNRKKEKRYINTHNFNYTKLLFILISIIVTAASFLVIYNLYKNKNFSFPSFNETENGNREIESVSIDILQYNLIDKILKTKPPVFYYSNDEVINDFNAAKKLIKNEKYNEALILINKIGNSNANYRVLERIDFLRKFISNIEYKSYSDIPVDKVFLTPYLYKGSFVKWKGKIANLKKKDSNLSFNLLIDYEKDYKFSGVIDVYLDKINNEIRNGDIVILNGVFINTIGSESRLYISADKVIKIK